MEIGLDSSSSMTCPSDPNLNTSSILYSSQSPPPSPSDHHQFSDSVVDRLVSPCHFDAAAVVGRTVERENGVEEDNEVIENVSRSQELSIRVDEDGGEDGFRSAEREKREGDVVEKMEVEDSVRQLSVGIGSDRLDDVITADKGGKDGVRAVEKGIRVENVVGNRETEESEELLSNGVSSNRFSTVIAADKDGKYGHHAVEIGNSGENADVKQEMEDLSCRSSSIIPPETVFKSDGIEDGNGTEEKEYDEENAEEKREKEDSEKVSSGRICSPRYPVEIVDDGDGGDSTLEKDYNEENAEEKRETENASKNEDSEKELSGTRSSYRYPVRPDAENCTFFIRTGTCKFGMNCKFNHPSNHRKFQAKAKEECAENTSKQVKEMVESVDKEQIDCKYFDRPGGCKFGKSCKFNHSRKPSIPLKLNFMGLPVRLGEKECPFYMRNCSCKFGANCRFNHPDPTSVGGTDGLLRYDNGGSILSPKALQSNFTSWSPPPTLNGSPPYLPLLFSPTPSVPTQSEWNAYQAPVYPHERNIHIPPTYAMNTHLLEKPKQVMGDEFPERPGQPECSYFIRNGNCKYRSACKFHHPKSATAQSLPCLLSDLGLPIRPGEIVCSYFTRYGICKYGPACKYDHPINQVHSSELAVSAVDQTPVLGDSMVKNQAMAGES